MKSKTANRPCLTNPDSNISQELQHVYRHTQLPKVGRSADDPQLQRTSKDGERQDENRGGCMRQDASAAKRPAIKASHLHAPNKAPV
eukprot:6464332-Amphidinium_carterae.1